MTQRALDVLAQAGVRLVEVSVADEVEVGSGAGMGLVLYEAARLLVSRAAGRSGSAAPRELADLVDSLASPDVRAVAEMMAAAPVEDSAYEQARWARAALRRSYAQTFETTGVHAMIAPTVPILPPPIGADETVELNGAQVPVFATITRHTGPGTVAGVPMLALPAGHSRSGLPVGVCLEGRFGADVELLAVGDQLASLLSAAGPADDIPAVN